jgi:hypothetical protein
MAKQDDVWIGRSQTSVYSARSSGDQYLHPQKCKTINSRYSLVVTHPTTNLPAHGLSTTERTGSSVFHVLWSIARKEAVDFYMFMRNWYCFPCIGHAQFILLQFRLDNNSRGFVSILQRCIARNFVVVRRSIYSRDRILL